MERLLFYITLSYSRTSHTLLWCRVIPPFRNQYFKIVNKRKSYWGNYGLRTHVNWSCFWSGSATNKFSTALSLLHWVLLLIHGDNHDMTKVNAKKREKLYRLNSSRLTHNMAFRVIYRRMSWRDITSKANESWTSFSLSLSLKTLIVLVGDTVAFLITF